MVVVLDPILEHAKLIVQSCAFMDRVRVVGCCALLSKKREKMETIPSIGARGDMGAVKVGTLTVLNLCIPGCPSENASTRKSAYRYNTAYRSASSAGQIEKFGFLQGSRGHAGTGELDEQPFHRRLHIVAPRFSRISGNRIRVCVCA